MSHTILIGDARAQLATLPDQSVQTCVTSPPYFGLRSYLDPEQEGKALEIGTEPTVEGYVQNLVAVFREVRRVLRDDGTLWLNLGDSYAAARGGTHQPAETLAGGKNGYTADGKRVNRGRGDTYNPTRDAHALGLKHKDLIGIPWRVAFALQADGWWLRQDIVWSKPNPMPESVTDRCTKSHEYIFLLSKSARYYYDAAAIAEPALQPNGDARLTGQHKADAGGFTTNGHGNSTLGTNQGAANRNKRSVWTVSTTPYSGAHFATFPPKLIEPCILAGSSERGQCRACGAPWVRVVERTTAYTSGSGKAGNVPNGKYKGTEQAESGTYDIRMGPSIATTTKGWAPSCTCDAGEPVPQTVLDPFAGSGTTGAVAEYHGRHAVMVELNPEYVALIRKRLAQRPLWDALTVEVCQ